MKTILVATDFSDAAQNACVYAAWLANSFKARLVLFNAYELVPYPATEVPVELPLKDLKAQSMAGLWNAWQALPFQDHGIEIETMSREGIVVNEIIEAAREIDADIIVAGMKAEGKGYRKIFGSTVTALARKSDIPLIVVPQYSRFTKPTTIALATEHDAQPDIDVNMFNILRQLTSIFQSRLYLVRITKNRFNQENEIHNRPLRLMGILKALDPKYECIEGKNEERGLNEFTHAFNVDILALLPHRHSLLDRWFTRSTTRTMVFETDIPLLVIPGLSH